MTEQANASSRHKKILAELVGILDELLEELEEDPVDIDFDTTFFQDLCINSIEFIGLAEHIQEKYGDTLQFTDWFAEKSVDQIMALKLGEVVGYIDSKLPN